MNEKRHNPVAFFWVPAFFAFLIIVIAFLIVPVDSSHAQTTGNQPPVFDTFKFTLTASEGTPIGGAIGDPLAVSDPDGDSLYYALVDGHTDLFSIDSSTGQVRARVLLDFETKDEDYWLHVSVRDSKDSGGGTDLVADDLGLVVIQVVNMDEPGTVSLNWRRAWVGRELSATHTDPDGGVTGTSWQWKRSNTRTGYYTNIPGETSNTYTPVAEDIGKYLQVSVNYTDLLGSGKSAEFTFANAVASVNSADRTILNFYDGDSTTRAVAENAPPGTNIGSAIRASGGSGLLYTLSGTDASYFSVNSATGQLQTRAPLNYEDKNAYSAILQVTNVSGGSDTIDVTIEVNDEPVEILGPSRVEFSEGDHVYSNLIHHFDIVPNGADLSLSGTDAGHFTLVDSPGTGTHGRLTMNEAPDYEAPSDSGRNNVYNITINASEEIDGTTHTSRLNVQVVVTNHNEGPVVAGPEAVEFTEQTTGPVARYTARDPENDPIRWSVQDTDDWTFFEISRSGVLSFGEPPDFENPGVEGNIYEVVVLAQSGMNMATDGERVQVTVTDSAIDPPLFDEGYSQTRTVAENTAGNTPIGDPVSARDSQGNPVTSYAISGSDARYFSIDSATGQLKTRTALDYETRNSYTVTVRASSGGLASQASVTVLVTNQEEGGTVSLSTNRARTSTPLAATLNDPDGGVTGQSWIWESSDNRNSWTPIGGATSAVYTPADEHLNKYLRATVSYTDAFGPNKSAEAVSGQVGRRTSPSTSTTPTQPSTPPASNPPNVVPGTVSVSYGATAYRMSEGAAAQITVRLSSPASGSLRVPLTISRGTAESGDYGITGLSGGYLTFRQGSRSSSFVITASQDADDEDETVNLAFGTLPHSVTAGSIPGATLTITDDDADTATLPSVSYGSRVYRMNEGAAAQITVRLSSPAPSSLRVPLTISRGTAESGDYGITGLSGGNLTFREGSRSSSFIITARQDSDDEEETINLAFGTLPHSVSAGSISGAIVTITDDDADTVTLPSVSYGSRDYRMNEGAAAQITVRLSSPAPSSLRLPLTISRGTAESGDYGITGLSSGNLTFSQGSRSSSFIVTARQDSDDEDETINLAFGTLPSNVSLGSIPNATITILDDEKNRIDVSFGSSAYRMNEGAAAQVTVRLSSPAPSSLRVPLTISRGTAESGDYGITGLSGGNLTFSQGSRSSSFIVTARQDSDAEDETINLAFGTLPHSLTVGYTPGATLTIVDDEADTATLPSISYGARVYRMNEGAAAQITVRLSSPAPSSLRVPVTISRGTAETGDYGITRLSSGYLTFSQGSRSSSFIVTARQDSDAEDETINLAFGTLPYSISLGSIPNATITILDDEKNRINVSYGSGAYNVNEGAAAQITVRLSLPAPSSLQVPVTITRGTAESGDYRVSGLSNGYLVFSQGSRSSSFIITALQDNDANDETLNLAFGSLPASAIGGPNATATFTIYDDERAKMTVSYGSAVYSVHEGAAAQITVRLSSPAPIPLLVPVTITRGTAESGDYRIAGLSSGYLVFSQGSRSSSFIISALQDIDANDETLNLALGALPQSVSAGPTPAARLTISDDEVPAPLQLSMSYSSPRYAVFEGRSIVVTVRLSSTSGSSLRVPITTTNQTAEQGDYQLSGLTNGALNFGPGDRSQSFTFTALQDDDADDELVNLGFGTLPRNTVTDAHSAGTVTIEDDDLTPALPKSVNAPPRFVEGARASRTVAEQAGRGTPVGLPVRAIDPDGDILSYDLSGTDASYFSLDSRAGQLQVWEGMDLELKSTYQITMSVSDGRGGTDSITVSVNLADIREVSVSNPTTQFVGLVAPGTATSLETPDGVAAIYFPQDFRESPVFVRVESVAVNCVGKWPVGESLAFLTVQTFDTWGGPIYDPDMEKALGSLRFDSTTLGGVEDVAAAQENGTIQVYNYRKKEAEWVHEDASLDVDELGVATLNVKGLTELSCLAVFTLPVHLEPALLVAEPEATPDPSAEKATDQDGRSPQIIPAPAQTEDVSKDSEPPDAHGEVGPTLVKASIVGDFPWWPRVFIMVGGLLLVAAIGWQFVLADKDRRRLQKAITRVSRQKATDVTRL